MVKHLALVANETSELQQVKYHPDYDASGGSTPNNVLSGTGRATNNNNNNNNKNSKSSNSSGSSSSSSSSTAQKSKKVQSVLIRMTRGTADNDTHDETRELHVFERTMDEDDDDDEKEEGGARDGIDHTGLESSVRYDVIAGREQEEIRASIREQIIRELALAGTDASSSTTPTPTTERSPPHHQSLSPVARGGRSKVDQQGQVQHQKAAYEDQSRNRTPTMRSNTREYRQQSVSPRGRRLLKGDQPKRRKNDPPGKTSSPRQVTRNERSAQRLKSGSVQRFINGSPRRGEETVVQKRKNKSPRTGGRTGSEKIVLRPSDLIRRKGGGDDSVVNDEAFDFTKERYTGRKSQPNEKVGLSRSVVVGPQARREITQTKPTTHHDSRPKHDGRKRRPISESEDDSTVDSSSEDESSTGGSVVSAERRRIKRRFRQRAALRNIRVSQGPANRNASSGILDPISLLDTPVADAAVDFVSKIVDRMSFPNPFFPTGPLVRNPSPERTTNPVIDPQGRSYVVSAGDNKVLSKTMTQDDVTTALFQLLSWDDKKSDAVVANPYRQEKKEKTARVTSPAKINAKAAPQGSDSSTDSSTDSEKKGSDEDSTDGEDTHASSTDERARTVKKKKESSIKPPSRYVDTADPLRAIEQDEIVKDIKAAIEPETTTQENSIRCEGSDLKQHTTENLKENPFTSSPLDMNRGAAEALPANASIALSKEDTFNPLRSMFALSELFGWSDRGKATNGYGESVEMAESPKNAQGLTFGVDANNDQSQVNTHQSKSEEPLKEAELIEPNNKEENATKKAHEASDTAQVARDLNLILNISSDSDDQKLFRQQKSPAVNIEQKKTDDGNLLALSSSVEDTVASWQSDQAIAIPKLERRVLADHRSTISRDRADAEVVPLAKDFPPKTYTRQSSAGVSGGKAQGSDDSLVCTNEPDGDAGHGAELEYVKSPSAQNSAFDQETAPTYETTKKEGSSARVNEVRSTRMRAPPKVPENHIQELEAKFRERRVRNASVGQSQHQHQLPTKHSVSKWRTPTSASCSVMPPQRSFIPSDVPITSKNVAKSYIQSISKERKVQSSYANGHVDELSERDSGTESSEWNKAILTEEKSGIMERNNSKSIPRLDVSADTGSLSSSQISHAAMKSFSDVSDPSGTRMSAEVDDLQIGQVAMDPVETQMPEDVDDLQIGQVAMDPVETQMPEDVDDLQMGQATMDRIKTQMPEDVDDLQMGQDAMDPIETQVPIDLDDIQMGHAAMRSNSLVSNPIETELPADVGDCSMGHVAMGSNSVLSNPIETELPVDEGDCHMGHVTMGSNSVVSNPIETELPVDVDDLVSKIDSVVQRLIEKGKLPATDSSSPENSNLGARTLRENTAELLRNLSILRSRRSGIPEEAHHYHRLSVPSAVYSGRQSEPVTAPPPSERHLLSSRDPTQDEVVQETSQSRKHPSHNEVVQETSSSKRDPAHNDVLQATVSSTNKSSFDARSSLVETRENGPSETNSPISNLARIRARRDKAAMRIKFQAQKLVALGFESEFPTPLMPSKSSSLDRLPLKNVVKQPHSPSPAGQTQDSAAARFSSSDMGDAFNGPVRLNLDALTTSKKPVLSEIRTSLNAPVPQDLNNAATPRRKKPMVPPRPDDLSSRPVSSRPRKNQIEVINVEDYDTVPELISRTALSSSSSSALKRTDRSSRTSSTSKYFAAEPEGGRIRAGHSLLAVPPSASMQEWETVELTKLNLILDPSAIENGGSGDENDSFRPQQQPQQQYHPHPITVIAVKELVTRGGVTAMNAGRYMEDYENDSYRPQPQPQQQYQPRPITVIPVEELVTRVGVTTPNAGRYTEDYGDDDNYYDDDDDDDDDNDDNDDNDDEETDYTDSDDGDSSCSETDSERLDRIATMVEELRIRRRNNDMNMIL